ncbi:YolD-like family protein [Paenibacillus sp. PL91]|uniref:YolD-like family protein n=1 Tax=Paenibacillus sp. PL91 TaxID=2729538 RepID=UPI00145F114F|nr:YolD-like family protein [Paenibacillus sp. PL91]MBC9204707.1 YolD-like family protein [Paenibacillus sp. PL91]
MVTGSRKKLEGNGMWESSRMMLPEHKVALNVWDRERHKRTRIHLDEQEWEDVSRAVAQSMQQREPIKLKMYHEFEELEIIGIVDRVNQLKSQFMVDGEWFLIKNIEGAQLEN